MSARQSLTPQPCAFFFIQVLIPEGLQAGQAFQVATDQQPGIFPQYTQPSPQYMQQSQPGMYGQPPPIGQMPMGQPPPNFG